MRDEARTIASASRGRQLLAWSDDTAAKADERAAGLAQWLQAHADSSLADAASELNLTDPRLAHRRVLVARDRDDGLRILQDEPGTILSAVVERTNSRVAFLLPGQGGQYVGMGRDLYESQPLFRTDIDRCCEYLKTLLNIDLRDVLYPTEENLPLAAQQLGHTRIIQTSLFTIEYALCRQWMRWGLVPKAMIGHSLGEYAAACIAGVFQLEDALRLVTARAKLMQQVAGGAMLTVMLPEEELRANLEQIGGLEIAVINTPSSCVVSGSRRKIESLEALMSEREIMTRRLKIPNAGHSAAMEPILEDFREVLMGIPLRTPHMPYLSNLTGSWVTGEEIVKPDYWVRHLRHAVRFSEGAAELLKDPDLILLEVGPGTALSKLIAQHPARSPNVTVASSLPPAHEPQPDLDYMLQSLGQLWMRGAEIDLSQYYEDSRTASFQTKQ